MVYNTPQDLIPLIAQLPKPALVGISGFGGSGKSTLAQKLSQQISCATLSVDGFFKTNFKNYQGETMIHASQHLTSPINQVTPESPSARYQTHKAEQPDQAGEVTLADQATGDQINQAPLSTPPNYQWIDFDRLRSQVLIPFLEGQTLINYQEFNWETGILDIQATLTIPESAILVLEGVGLFRPGIKELCTLKIWIDCPIEVATSRGKLRDKQVYGVDNDILWDGIWKQNDLAHYQIHEPYRVADLVIESLC